MADEGHDLRLKEETFQIVGAAMEVLNTLGHGLLEKPYERALAVEFRLRGIPYVQQRPFEVIYKSENVGDYVPDLIVYEKIIVEVKCVEMITNIDRAQVANYLKITGLSLGLVLNFKHPKLYWDRVVFD